MQKGQRIKGKINKISDLGLFVSLGGKLHGLVHNSEIDGELSKFEVGQEIWVVVLNDDDQKIALSIKQFADPELVDPTSSIEQSEKPFADKLQDLIDNSKSEIKKLSK